MVFRVRDSGMGIPAEALATIFELFRQLGHGAGSCAGRTGRRADARQAAGRNAWRARSKRERRPCEGQRVRRSPAAACRIGGRKRRRKIRVGRRRGAAPPRRRRRILVADDNVDLATSMGLLLEMMGNDVRVAHDGMAAVAADSEFRPDVVFLDIGMAKMNGLDACRQIRGKPWGKEPVIVALTGWGQAEDKRRSREAGFDHHLVKPIEPAVLRALSRRNRTADGLTARSAMSNCRQPRRRCRPLHRAAQACVRPAPHADGRAAEHSVPRGAGCAPYGQRRRRVQDARLHRQDSRWRRARRSRPVIR